MHRGDLIVKDRQAKINDMVGGDLIIEGISQVDLTGMVGGSVRLHAGTLHVRGMVRGDVINEGGNLTVHGMVTGSVRTLAGTTVVEKCAMVGGTVSS